MAAVCWALLAGLVFAIVTDHGRLPAACTASAIAGFTAASFIVSWRIGHELRVERGHIDRWNLADTRYDLDVFPSPKPGPRRAVSD